MITPTAGTIVIEENGRKRRVAVRSYGVALAQIGGSELKIVRLDKQTSMGQAVRTALEDNPGYNFLFVRPLMDRDFEGSKGDEKQSEGGGTGNGILRTGQTDGSPADVGDGDIRNRFL